MPLCAELERLHDHGLQLADVHEMDADAWWTATRAAVEILVLERDGLARRLADANTHNETEFAHEFAAVSARSEQVGHDISDPAARWSGCYSATGWKRFTLQP